MIYITIVQPFTIILLTILKIVQPFVQLFTYFDVTILTVQFGLLLFLLLCTHLRYEMMLFVFKMTGVLPGSFSATQNRIRSLNRTLSYLLMSLMNGILSLRTMSSLGPEYPAGKLKLVWVGPLIKEVG
jgi:hypothetical protein